jgi:hypothetical protein
MDTLKIEHETFDFQGVLIYSAGSVCRCPCPPAGDSRRYDEEFWRELQLLGASAGNHKRSKEQNLKELGFDMEEADLWSAF